MKIIDDSEFAEFFNEVLKSDLNEDFKKPLINSDYKLKSNILMLTSACNLECDYCYQLEDRNKLKKQTFISKQEVNKFFNELLLREPEKDSTVVLFGGEPFLNPEIIYYILDLTDKITEYKNKKFNLSLTTNGTYFLDKQKALEFIYRIQNLRNHFSLEISYDGIGHNRRVFKNGKNSRYEVEQVLDFFKEIKFQVSIRYTIHKDNFENCLMDFVILSRNENIKKIIANFYEQELELFTNVNELKEKLKRQTCEIFKRTKTPICHLNCRACLGCNFAEFDGIYYQYNSNNFEVNANVEKFDYFTNTK